QTEPTGAGQPTEAGEQEPAGPTRRRPGRPVTIVLWLVVAGFASWAAVRGFGLESGDPFIQFISFTPYVAAAAVLPLTAAPVPRRWLAAVVAGLVTVALAACVLPRTFGDGGPLPAGPTLRVLTANMLVGGADPVGIVALVRDDHVDLLALQEYTAEA